MIRNSRNHKPFNVMARTGYAVTKPIEDMPPVIKNPTLEEINKEARKVAYGAFYDTQLIDFKNKTDKYWDIIENNNKSDEEKAEAYYGITKYVDREYYINSNGIDSYEPYKVLQKYYPKTDWAGCAKYDDIGFMFDLEWADWKTIPEEYDYGYDNFLKDYPEHKLACSAMFGKAKTTLALAGYPEAFDNEVTYVKEKDIEQRKDIMSKYFPGSKYLYPISDESTNGETSISIDSKKLSEAETLFNEILQKYPGTESAKLSNYYLGVIQELCYNDKQKAKAFYREFIDANPENSEYLENAKKLLE